MFALQKYVARKLIISNYFKMTCLLLADEGKDYYIVVNI